MAKSTTSRQKYNFLIAFCRQLEEAADDGADEYAEFRRVAESLFPNDNSDEHWTRLEDRVSKLEQWLSQIELALEELEPTDSEGDGEDADLADDGCDDTDVGGDEPPLERVARGDTRLARPRSETGRAEAGRAVNVCARKERRRG